MTHKEKWLHRCKCKACSSVIWIDLPTTVICVCSATWIGADGSLGGDFDNVTDEEMIKFIQQDWGLRDVELNKIAE